MMETIFLVPLYQFITLDEEMFGAREAEYHVNILIMWKADVE